VSTQMSKLLIPAMASQWRGRKRVEYINLFSAFLYLGESFCLHSQLCCTFLIRLFIHQPPSMWWPVTW
jgi:hypothetical protein